MTTGRLELVDILEPPAKPHVSDEDSKNQFAFLFDDRSKKSDQCQAEHK